MYFIRKLINNLRMDPFKPSSEPLGLTVLVLSGASMMSVASTIDPLRAANRVSGRELFRWQMVSLDGRAVATTCDVAVPVTARFDASGVADVLVVVAGFGAREHVSRAFVQSLRTAARRAQLVVGVESAPWLMAMAGLLDRRRATTHWEDLEDFQTAHPRVDVRPDRYVIDGTRVSTGGASPTFDFMLHLIRSRCGYHVALDAASVFGYDESHPGTDAQPLVSLGRLSWYEPRVADASRVMEAHLDAPLTQAEIARQIGVTPRTLEKLFAATVGQTPGRFFATLRLGAARRMVVDTRLAMADVALRCGFSSASAFARAFRRHYGVSARTLREQQRTGISA